MNCPIGLAGCGVGGVKISAKLALAAAVAAVFLFVLLAALLVVLGAGQNEEERQALLVVLDNRAGAALMVVFVACGFLFAMLRWAHEKYVVAPARAAEEAGAMLGDVGRRLTLQGGEELRALLDVINRVAAGRQSHELEIEARVRSANARAEEETNRFATLVAELAQGVVVCNADGRILLYNRRARELFSDDDGVANVASIGLGRSIYAVLDRQIISYSLEKVAGHHEPDSPLSSHFVAAVGSGRLLRVELAPVRSAGGVAAADEARAAGEARDLPAYLLVLDDITATFESESKRDILLQGMTQGVRGPLANLRAAAETLHDYPDMDGEERGRFLTVIRDEAQSLGNRVEAAAREFASVVRTRWPLEEMAGADLLAAACQRIEQRTGMRASLEEVAPDLRVKVDGFSILQAITYLAARLRDDQAVREVRLRLTGDRQMAHVDLLWSGGSMSNETEIQWELDPMHEAGETTPLTVRDVVERCGGEIWFQRHRASQRAYFRFLLPAVSERKRHSARTQPSVATDTRPEFYDFDLFKRWDTEGDLDNCPLVTLSYTVFDTETTGLDPTGGDEIIQIGAVRIVNRRLLRQENFEQLIDPRRPLPPKSVKVHGITQAMLAGQPAVERVLPVFRAFVADTVLVAHNAAFDMRFLELKEEKTGVRFDRPVLDTFLLSAAIFPNQESHRLEAIAERVGVTVVGRHTALGDAIVTGEIFLKMLDLLAERGIHTLRQAREASEATFHARITY
jgi:DNA polymerase-3 subunit epsilon